MADDELTAGQRAEVEGIVGNLASPASAESIAEIETTLGRLRSELSSLENRLSQQSTGFTQCTNALLGSVTELVNDFKSLHTATSETSREFQQKHRDLEDRLRDFEGTVSDYPRLRETLETLSGSVEAIRSDIGEMKKPFLKRWRFWAASSSTLLVIIAFFFGDGFFENDPVLPYYMHKLLRTDSGIAQSLKFGDATDLSDGITSATFRLMDNNPDFQSKLVRKAHEKPVYAFHGAQWFQQEFVRIPHPACLAQEHPGFDRLVEYSLYVAQEEMGTTPEFNDFVASVREFDCSVAKEFPLATSASLEIPFYGRPGTDDIDLEVLVNYSVWDDEADTWSEQTIKIDKFDVSVNGGLKIPSETFERLQPLGGVYRADISAQMQEDPNSRALDYHVLSIRLLDETLLLGEPGDKEVPIVRAQAIVYLNRVQ